MILPLLRSLSLGVAVRLLMRPLVVIPATSAVTPPPIEVHDLTDVLPKHPTKEYPMRPMGMKDIDGAIIHHSATSIKADHSTIARYHIAKGWAGAGYHRAVDVTGAIWIYNHDDRWTNHTAGHNRHNVSLMCIGNFMHDSVTVEMERSVNWQLDEWDKFYSLTSIIPHKWTKATQCPGDHVMEAFGDRFRHNRITVR
jgi:hypothetical protein